VQNTGSQGIPKFVTKTVENTITPTITITNMTEIQVKWSKNLPKKDRKPDKKGTAMEPRITIDDKKDKHGKKNDKNLNKSPKYDEKKDRKKKNMSTKV